MANKRMINASVVSNDLFVDMPLSAQCLYFHLNVNADDDGFVDSPKRIQRSIGACDDDLKLLIAKGFIIAFQSGVIVITHWKMHNTIKKDRYARTIYTKELKQLSVEDCFAGPEKDRDTQYEGWIFKFAPLFENTKLYIKIRVESTEKSVCLSVHEFGKYDEVK